MPQTSAETDPPKPNVDEKPCLAEEDVYRLYIDVMRREETNFLNSANASMDSTLVYAGLFSAVISALIVETRKSLVVDPHERMLMIMEALYNHTAGVVSDIHQDPFVAPPWAVFVNLMFFIALSCSLLSGLGGLLVKQWARQSTHGPRKPESTRSEARMHHETWSGLLVWRVDIIIAAIPMLLHVALLLFFSGMLAWIFEGNIAVFGALVYLIGGAVLLYVGTGIASARHRNAPFKWPFASVLGHLIPHANRFDLEANISMESQTRPSSIERSLNLVTISTPPSIEKTSLCLIDDIDEDIFFNVLKGAINGDEIANILDHFVQIAAFGSLHRDIMTPRLVQLSLDRCQDLAIQCCEFAQEPSRDAMRPDCMWRARMCCRYLGWIFTSGRTLIPATASPPTKAFRMARIFRKGAIRARAIEDMQLAMDVLCHSQAVFYFTDPNFNLENLFCTDGTELLLQLAPKFGEESWKDIGEYQMHVGKFIWCITLPLLEYAATDPVANSGQSASVLPASQGLNVSRGYDPASSIPVRLFLNEFPADTPPVVRRACSDLRWLLGNTEMAEDDQGVDRNQPLLKARLTTLWESEGASGWAFIWLRGILGPLGRDPVVENGVRRVIPLPDGSVAFRTVHRE